MKNEEMVYNNSLRKELDELATSLNITLNNSPFRFKGKNKFFSTIENIRLGDNQVRCYSATPSHNNDATSIRIEIVNENEEIIADGIVKELHSFSHAKQELVGFFLFRSMIPRVKREHSIGNLCLIEERTSSESKIMVIWNCCFIRGNTAVKLTTRAGTTNLLELAKAIDNALLWAIWRKRLLGLCVVISLVTLFYLCFRKRVSKPKNLHEIVSEQRNLESILE